MNLAGAIPLIDIARARASAVAQREVARQLRDVSGSLGFAYISGSGIAPELLAATFRRSTEFFASGSTRKERLARGARIDAGLGCGYVPPGREHEDQATPSDIKEAFDVFAVDGYIRDAYPGIGEQPAVDAELRPLLDDLRRFHTACAQVARELLRLFAHSFDLPESYFVARHGGNDMLRLLHYPPIERPPLPGQLRVGEHTDFGTLTLLFMDGSGGLEIAAELGRWIPAPLIAGTILVNIGDLMERWTDGELRSTRHRVVVPADARAGQSRYSIAFFCEPNSDVVVASPRADLGVAGRFPPVQAGAYMRARLGATLIASTD